ncbi:MAG: sulfotransferase [Pseudohongiella sp.]|nr:sulfotransferase [Pseudohongiella sp.]
MLEQVQAAVRSGDITTALTLLAQARQEDPLNPHAWQLAAELAAHVRDWPELQRIASCWTRMHPTSVAAWQSLSRSHFEDSQFNEAIAAYARVLALQPGNAGHLVAAARLATAALQYDCARSYLDAAEALSPDSGEVLYALSRLHHLSGELALAEVYCRRAIRVMPGYAPAYTALGVLTEGRLDDAEIANIAQLAKHPGMHPEYRAMLYFTLGDALDRKGEYDHAFAAWKQANQINSGISAQEGIFYNAQQHEEDVALLAGIFADPFAKPFAEDFLQNQDGCTGSGLRPVFVVGMPRSATTLAESILASHSGVHGAGELPTLLDTLEGLLTIARRDGIAVARETLRSQAGRWRQRYLDALPCAHGKAHVVDKQPLNFRAIGLIRVLFPESPVIYTQRNMMDVGLSIFRHNFSKNWPCAHKLSDIGHYYRVHEQIVALWQQRYPDAIHVMDHAALVSDQESEIRKLIAFAGLEFEEACLTPHKTRRQVATFSSVQVQRPVSSSYSGRAAHYARAMGTEEFRGTEEQAPPSP